MNSTPRLSFFARPAIRLFAILMSLLALAPPGCDHDIDIKLASEYSAIPAPEFLMDYERSAERGKLNQIRVYETSDDASKDPTLIWSSAATGKLRAKDVYRFTYGVSPLGMRNTHKPADLREDRVYEVCVEGRQFNCDRFRTDSEGVLKPVKRPRSAYRNIPSELR